MGKGWASKRPEIFLAIFGQPENNEKTDLKGGFGLIAGQPKGLITYLQDSSYHENSGNQLR